MKPGILCLLLGTGLLTGCWQKSLNAFYTPADVVPEPKIVGVWQEVNDQGQKKEQIWKFTEGTEKAYKLEFKNDEQTLHYNAHIFKFDGQRFMDIVSLDGGLSTIPAHHLFKLHNVGTNLQMAMLNADWMQKHLRQNPAALAHISIADPEHCDDREKDEIVLTADTKALQTFLRQHSGDSDLFTGLIKFEPQEVADKK